MPRFSDAARAKFIAESIGKTIRDVEWLPDEPGEEGYWVVHFTDGSGLSVRLMAELVESAVAIPWPWHCTRCGILGTLPVANQASAMEGLLAIEAAHQHASPHCPAKMGELRLGEPDPHRLSPPPAAG